MQLDIQPQRQHRPMTDPEPQPTQPSAQTPAQPRASLYVLLLSLAVDATTPRPTPPNPTAPPALMPRGQT
jgi:hypothetical protein